jgi:phage terminase small subunit
MKLNRSQIKEALEQTPIDKLLLGGNAKDISLTHKQKAFCEEIAKGSSKAKAYRTAYNSKSSSHTQSKEGTKLMNNPKISSHIDALKVAIEAQKYLFPTHLRALVIQQLTEKALDPSVNHAQQIRCLELIAKFNDVALFNERKETKTDTNSTDAKARLLYTLTNAIRTSRTISEDKKKSAQDLLNEIAKGIKDKDEPMTIDQEPSHDDEPTMQETEPTIIETENDSTPGNDDPTHADPPKNFKIEAGPMHTIPNKQSPDLNEMPPLSFTESEWGGVDKFWETFEKAPEENTPLDDLGSHTPNGDINEKI